MYLPNAVMQMGFMNIKTLTEPATNVTSDNCNRHLMEICYNLLSNTITIYCTVWGMCIYSLLLTARMQDAIQLDCWHLKLYMHICISYSFVGVQGTKYL